MDGGVQTAGNFRWSIEEWLKGDVVDEVCLSSPAAEPVIASLMKKIHEQQSPLKLTVFRSRGELPPKTPRVMYLGREIESGYPSEAWIDYPDEQLTPEPVDSLNSPDIYARRRVLTLALKGIQPLSPEQYSKAVSDSDLYVRRTALRAIAKHKVQGVTAAVIPALHDPENTVTCLAAVALAEIDDPQGLEPLVAAAFDPKSTFQLQSRAIPEAFKKLAAVEPSGTALKKRLVPELCAPLSKTRELALYYFTLIGAPATPEVEKSLSQIVLHDENEYSRELALVNLRSSFGATAAVTQTIRTVMQKDPSHAVQVRAVTAFSMMHARLAAEDPVRKQALEEAVTYFRQYGDGCQRTDREWGWRLLGNSLLEFGPAGEDALKALMTEASNRDLSDRAWRILYLKQGDQFYPVTEAEDSVAHQQHPWKK